MMIRIYGLAVSKNRELRVKVRKIAKMEGFEKDLNIIFTDADHMRKLNFQYLSRDYVTDVLSFDLDDICEIYILNEARGKFNTVWELVLHGLLHLMGYDHKTSKQKLEMEKKAKFYLVC